MSRICDAIALDTTQHLDTFDKVTSSEQQCTPSKSFGGVEKHHFG
jgi:hypothetical protein